MDKPGQGAFRNRKKNKKGKKPGKKTSSLFDWRKEMPGRERRQRLNDNGQSFVP